MSSVPCSWKCFLFFVLANFVGIRLEFPQAEFRYGREEMLSLYDKNFKLPELLPNYHKLFIEKMQGPLALLPPTSDEEVVRTESMPFHDFYLLLMFLFLVCLLWNDFDSLVVYQQLEHWAVKGAEALGYLPVARVAV